MRSIVPSFPLRSGDTESPVRYTAFRSDVLSMNPIHAGMTIQRPVSGTFCSSSVNPARRMMSMGLHVAPDRLPAAVALAGISGAPVLPRLILPDTTPAVSPLFPATTTVDQRAVGEPVG